MNNILTTLYHGKNLTQKQSEHLIHSIIQKKLSTIQIAAALISMKVRGETYEEIIGAANALLAHSQSFPIPNNELFADIVGTGGDLKNTINISTASAIVAATCNAKIVKHGNRNISGLTGSMDLWNNQNHLNIKEHNIQAYKNFDKLGICFLYAPRYHTVLHHIMPIRRQLNTPTLFNIVGPLINPSYPPLILVGVYNTTLLSPVAQALKSLQYHHAIIVHCDGIDEVGLHAPTHIIELQNNTISQYTLTASDFGLNSYPIESLSCHSRQQAHEYFISLLKGKGTPAHECVVAANVALLLKLFGYNNLLKNAKLALEKIHQGEPYVYFKLLSKNNAEHKST